MGLSDSQLRDAIRTGGEFWEALAADDDEALRRLLTASVMTLLAGDAMLPGTPYGPPETIDEALRSPGAGVAARLRAHMGTEFPMDGLPGLSDKAELLEGDQLRLTYPVVGIARVIEEDVGVLVWRLEFALDEGAWLIDPVRRHDLPTLEIIDLGPLLRGDA